MISKTAMQGLLAMLVIALSACASVSAALVSKPEVRLSNVQVVGLGFKSQTFLLSFNVSNPNPFAVPVNGVAFGVKLDGQRFATGETRSSFTIPAGDDSQFAISVDLNLLSTSPQLLAAVRDGVREEIPYELKGRLNVDLPAVDAISYRYSGTVRLDGSATSFLSW